MFWNISGNDTQNALEFGIGIIGNSNGIFGGALQPGGGGARGGAGRGGGGALRGHCAAPVPVLRGLAVHSGVGGGLHSFTFLLNLSRV